MPISNQRGYALLFALWVLLILAGFAELFLIQSRRGYRAATSVSQAAKARLELDGAINSTIVDLLTPARAIHVALNGSWEKRSILGVVVDVRVSNENGKLDINQASLDSLAMFLQAVGADINDPSAARELASRISGWRNPADSPRADSEADLYADADLPYRPRFSSFRSPEELRLTMGMTDAVFEKIAPVVTVWSNQSSIEIGVAADSTLEAMASWGNGLAQSELDARRNGKKNNFGPGPQIGEIFEIEARSSSAFVRMVRRAVVRLSGARRRPYEILSWR